jgi:hypothetical protein
MLLQLHNIPPTILLRHFPQRLRRIPSHMTIAHEELPSQQLIHHLRQARQDTSLRTPPWIHYVFRDEQLAAWLEQIV